MNKQKTQAKLENPMRTIKMEKIVLSCGATGQDIERSKKLLEILSSKKAQIIKTGPNRRIPDFGVTPKMEVGTRVTLRRDAAANLLKRLLGAIDNSLKENQIVENGFSFGIHEYIEIPGTEYQRDIGIRGLNVTVVFARAGARVKRKKIKSGRLPGKQHITPEEIIKYMEENFSTKIEIR